MAPYMSERGSEEMLDELEKGGEGRRLGRTRREILLFGRRKYGNQEVGVYYLVCALNFVGKSVYSVETYEIIDNGFPCLCFLALAVLLSG
jgi:hypothetical protein